MWGLVGECWQYRTGAHHNLILCDWRRTSRSKFLLLFELARLDHKSLRRNSTTSLLVGVDVVRLNLVVRLRFLLALPNLVVVVVRGSAMVGHCRALGVCPTLMRSLRPIVQTRAQASSRQELLGSEHAAVRVSSRQGEFFFSC